MSGSRRCQIPEGLYVLAAFKTQLQQPTTTERYIQCIRCEGNAHLVVLDISWNLCKMDCMRRGHWSGFHQRTSNSDQITINSKVILSMTCITIKPGKIDHSKHGLPVLMRRALLLLSREALTHMPGQAPQTDLKLGLPMLHRVIGQGKFMTDHPQLQQQIVLQELIIFCVLSWP